MMSVQEFTTVLFNTILMSVLLCVLPISELRGGLPFALHRGLPLVPAYFICVAANACVGPLVFGFLASAHKILDRWGFYHRLFERLVERSRSRVHAKVEKYGYIGLALFVAIPLPITGAYTGSLGAWVLGMDRRKSLIALTAGVFIAGVIVTVVFLLGIKPLYIFIKGI